MEHGSASSAFRLHVFSLEEVLWEGQATEVFLPGAEGIVCFLPDHTPLALSLTKGDFIIRSLYKEDGDEEFKTIPIKSGVAEIVRNECRVFCEKDVMD